MSISNHSSASSASSAGTDGITSLHLLRKSWPVLQPDMRVPTSYSYPGALLRAHSGRDMGPIAKHKEQSVLDPQEDTAMVEPEGGPRLPALYFISSVELVLHPYCFFL